jgi:uncharacterized membrane protein
MLTLLGAGQGQNGIEFDADYQAILDRAIALNYDLPTLSEQILQNDLLKAMKSSGVWAKLDVFYNFANNGSIGLATLNWKNPNSNQASLINDIGWQPEEGFYAPTSSFAYIDTNFAPSNGVQYQQNNASRYLYLFNSFNANALDGLAGIPGNSNSMFRTNGNQRINQGATPLNDIFNFTTKRGMKSIHRTSSTNITLYNDVLSEGRTATSSARDTANQCILRSNITYGNSTISMYAMGASLVGVENTAFVNAYDKYIDNINKYEHNYSDVIQVANSLGYILPSVSQQIKQEQLFNNLKDSGILDKLDVFYNFANDGSIEFGTLNWKMPYERQCTLINSPNFEPNQGIQGTGTSYISTNYNPTIDGYNKNKYVLNNASRHIYVGTQSATASTLDGVSSGNANASAGINTTLLRINQGANGNSNVANFAGSNVLKSIHRTSATDIELFVGTTQTSRTFNSTSVINEPQLILARGVNVMGGASYGTSIISMYAMGASLVSENTVFLNIYNTYINSI